MNTPRWARTAIAGLALTATACAEEPRPTVSLPAANEEHMPSQTVQAEYFVEHSNDAGIIPKYAEWKLEQSRGDYTVLIRDTNRDGSIDQVAVQDHRAGTELVCERDRAKLEGEWRSLKPRDVDTNTLRAKCDKTIDSWAVHAFAYSGERNEVTTRGARPTGLVPVYAGDRADLPTDTTVSGSPVATVTDSVAVSPSPSAPPPAQSNRSAAPTPAPRAVLQLGDVVITGRESLIQGVYVPAVSENLGPTGAGNADVRVAPMSAPFSGTHFGYSAGSVGGDADHVYALVPRSCRADDALIIVHEGDRLVQSAALPRLSGYQTLSTQREHEWREHLETLIENNCR